MKNCRYFLLHILLFLSVLLLVPPYRPVFAENKAGINIGTRYSDLNNAINVVGQGGWIVAIFAGTGDCKLQEFTNQTASANVNFVIRGHLNNNLTPSEATAWAATLGQLNTNGKKIYFMPWNEPNQEGSGDYVDATNLKIYTDALLSNTNQAGIRGGFSILSPAINITHPNRENYINSLGGGGYFSGFDAIAINLYDNGQAVCGNPMCNSDIFNNVGRVPDVLSKMGVPGKFTIITESGTDGNGNWYFDSPSPAANSALYNLVNEYRAKGTYPYAIPSYDLAGERSYSWSIFNPPDTVNALKTYPKGNTSNGSINKTAYDNWLKPFLDNGTLISCGQCGYAPKANPGLCTGSPANLGPNGKLFTPNRLVDPKSNIVSSVSDYTKLQQNAALSPGEFSRTVTRGGWFQEFHDLSIPFAQELTKYLAGPYVRDAGNNSNLIIKQFNDNPDAVNAGILAKLTPEEVQDDMRRAYRQNCLNSTYCSKRNIGSRPDCPNEASNECLISDGTDIGDIPEKPKPADINSLQSWYQNSSLQKKWHEIPLVSNPKTFIAGAISMQACPAGSDGTTVDIKYPWLSGLNDVSQILNDLLIPKGSNQQSLIPNNNPVSQQSPVLLASSTLSNGQKNPILLTQAGTTNSGCPVGINTNGQGNYTAVPNGSAPDYNNCYWHDSNITWTCDGVSHNGFSPVIEPKQPYHFDCPTGTKTVTFALWGSSGVSGPSHCVDWEFSSKPSCTCNIITDTNGKPTTSCASAPFTPGPNECKPPAVPPYKPDGAGDPLDTNLIDHALLREPHADLTCKKWVAGECVDGKDSVSYDDPVWAVVKYPFLNKIYENLSGEKGIFRIFNPAPNQTKDWADAGESKITYCFADFQSKAGEPSNSMIKGGGLNIGEKPFDKPLAQCVKKDYTKGLSAYPQYIGGTKNAKDWTVCTLNPGSNDCRKLQAEQSSQTAPTNTNGEKNCTGINPGSPACPVISYPDLPFRDKNDIIPNEKKQAVIENVKSRFKDSKISLDSLRLIEQQSQANGWSPAFVTALWIEETGASAYGNYPLGCILPNTESLTLERSLSCLFNNFDKIYANLAPYNFQNFMLQYSALKDLTDWHCFCTNPNFPGGIYREYYFVKNAYFPSQ